MSGLKPAPLPKKSILIVDDHPILRRGLNFLIESEPDLAVCGEATTHQAGLKAIQESLPDMVIVDIMLAGSDGLDLVKDMKILHPNTPALVLSMYSEEVYAERALRAGARGYSTKLELDETLLIAIHQVLDGQTYLSPTLKLRLAKKYIDGHNLETDGSLATLSDRQLQVFRLIGQGQTTRQIAENIHLSIKTIESHREQIKNKLSIESTAQLAQRATQWVEANSTL